MPRGTALLDVYMNDLREHLTSMIEADRVDVNDAQAVNNWLKGYWSAMRYSWKTAIR